MTSKHHPTHTTSHPSDTNESRDHLPAKVAVNPDSLHADHTTAQDNTLRAYFHAFQQEQAPSSATMERLFQSIPHTPQKHERVHPPFAWFAWLRWSLLPVSATAAFFLLWTRLTPLPLPSTHPPTHPAAHPPTIPSPYVAKSAHISVQLLYARQTSAGFVHKQAATPNTTLQEGDIVQFAYEAPQAMHLMVVSVHQKGEVSLYLPFERTHSLPIAQGKGFFPSDSSLILDHSVGKERFFFLAAPRPFAFQPIKARLQQAYQKAKGHIDQIRLDGSWQVTTLTLQKIPRQP